MTANLVARHAARTFRHSLENTIKSYSCRKALSILRVCQFMVSCYFLSLYSLVDKFNNTFADLDNNEGSSTVSIKES